MSDAKTAKRARELLGDALKRATYDLAKTEVRGGGGLFSNPTIERHAADMANNALRMLRSGKKELATDPSAIDKLADGEIALQWFILANALIAIDARKYVSEARQAIEALKKAGRPEAGMFEAQLNRKLGGAN